MLEGEPTTQSIFRYPLCWQALLLLGFVSLVSYFLIFASVLSYIFSREAPFYFLGIITAYLLINIVFEYGQEIVTETFHNRHEPPVLSIQSIESGRFFRQLVMTALFGSMIYGLIQYQLSNIAITLSVFVVLVLPASIAVNAIFEDLKEVINPRTLIAYVAVTKTSYLSSLVGLWILILLLYLSLEIGLWAFSLILPFWLYLSLVYFRHLGLEALAHRHILLPAKDFDAEKKEIEQHYSDNASLHTALEKAYLGLKDKQIQEAIDIVSPIIRTNNWARFEYVFGFISAWPSKKPAIHFVKGYLPVLHSQEKSIRAMELCAWCLKQDSAFSIDDVDLIDYLVSESVSKEQFIVVVKLMDNFATDFPQHEKTKPYLFRAADICQDKLHHSEKFLELQNKLESLDG